MSTEAAKYPRESKTVMTQMVYPQDTNSLNGIFGGVVMSWIDIAGAIAAQRHSGRTCVTASVDELHFLRSVRLGYIVNVVAQLTCVHKTSCEVHVEVTAENPILREQFPTTSAYLTFVALDSEGRPIEMPPLEAETDEEKQLMKEAILRKENRKKFKRQLLERSKKEK